ncbi:rRNA maturation RNase YbeY [Sediminibacterium ginsengisoli]|uniref:Endoribonuclease YbeY n=1 Tax=Sediminibacterium ginsengisoli TaxID=413434 RepID=A0A1T4ME95_9BACT|nr:rRNA maturation RNase YbeY [Sediminibacterium ginsengisoli]SJZ65262.1 rRNA maturation RNase YbeY [Sediminibacterium ginsengisoli]
MISFHAADRQLTLKNRTLLKEVVTRIFKHEKQRLQQLSYIFCSDEYLLQINRDFLQHDYYTDIITFGLSGKGAPIEGEVYISTDRVKDNAINEGTTYTAEMLRVIFHGALHLCGYKDKTKAEQQLMRSKEEEYIKAFQDLNRKS